MCACVCIFHRILVERQQTQSFAVRVVGSTLLEKGNVFRLHSSLACFLCGKVKIPDTHEEKHVQTSECELPCNVILFIQLSL